MRSLKYYIFASFLVVLGCRERFEGFEFQSHNEKLVIEAILTDNSELDHIRVSYTEPVDDEEIRDFVPEDAASVVVIDDQGMEYTFFSQGEGFYANETFSPDYGRQYRMQVQVGGNRYESDWQALPLATVPPIDIQYRPDTAQVLNALGTPVNEKVITLSDKVVKSDEGGYFYWQFNHFYIYDAYGQPDVVDLLPEAEQFCYVQQHDLPEIFLQEDNFVQGQQGTEYRLDITTVPFGRKMVYDYSVQVIRYNVSERIFEYLEEIREQINRVGGVFDAAPSSLKGNFTQVSGDIEVLGFFGVFNATSQRIFFNQDELPFNKLYFPTSAIDCPGDHNVELSNTCFNCTSVASPFNSVEKPAWWR